jgi:hypothetical protein
LTIDELADGVRLCQPPEPDTGIRKCFEIHLHHDSPGVTVIHWLRNDGAWPVELAPWAITQMPLGGLAILPQPSSASDPSSLLPNRHLVLWPYTSWRDRRLGLYDDFVLVQAEAGSPACKIGYLNQHGWIGYLRARVLFIKYFRPRLQRRSVLRRASDRARDARPSRPPFAGRIDPAYRNMAAVQRHGRGADDRRRA